MWGGTRHPKRSWQGREGSNAGLHNSRHVTASLDDPLRVWSHARLQHTVAVTMGRNVF
jgi:hypothetical protein